MAVSSTERRSRPRVLLDAEALVFKGEKRTACRTRDISSIGVSLISPEQTAPGTLLHLQIFLNRGGDSLVVDGILVREERTARGYLWGIQFHHPEPRVSATLVALVRNQIIRSNQESIPVAKDPWPAPGRRDPQAPRPPPGSQGLKSLYFAALKSLK